MTRDYDVIGRSALRSRVTINDSKKYELPSDWILLVFTTTTQCNEHQKTVQRLLIGSFFSGSFTLEIENKLYSLQHIYTSVNLTLMISFLKMALEVICFSFLLAIIFNFQAKFW